MRDEVTLHGGPLNGTTTRVRDKQTFLRTAAVVDGVLKEVTYVPRYLPRPSDGKRGYYWVWQGLPRDVHPESL